MSKDVVKPSEKPKPSVCKEITSKADVSLVSGKRITTKTASNKRSDQVQSHRQRREVQSSATVLDHASLTKSKIVSLSSGIRGGPPKTRSTPKSLSDRLPATSSVLTRSAQRSSKEMTTISHLRKFSVDNRICDGFGQRSLGLSGHHILPKSRESESQRPKVVLKNLPDRDKSNQNTGLERRSISSVKGRRQKKVNLVVYLIYSSYACIVSSLIFFILNPFLGCCFQNSLVIEYECLCPDEAAGNGP
ncbi:hypothetical protein NC652_031539 [Populus alba x Populus x berolinensis]|nr:hypothetical protein NC652_031539 [Populus alba x Populus x berolinensis]